MVRLSKQGSGLTESDVYHFDAELSPEDQQLFDQLTEEQTATGRLSAIEAACVDVLVAAGLPVGPGWYERGFANEPWPVARHRGFAPDCREGFAAKMLGDIHWIRNALGAGDHERAMILMFFLGVKWSASGIKERHASKSRPAQPHRKRARDVSLAQRFLKLKHENGRSAISAQKSDSALMETIGQEEEPSLKRSAAIAAVKRGLQILSG